MLGDLIRITSSNDTQLPIFFLGHRLFSIPLPTKEGVFLVKHFENNRKNSKYDNKNDNNNNRQFLKCVRKFCKEFGILRH